jgi:hypothetical protein
LFQTKAETGREPAGVFANGAASPARNLAVLAVLGALTLLPAAASAQDDEKPSRISFGAFGTLGLVYSTDRHADFAANAVRPAGPGGSETVSLDPDSLLAGQVTFQVTPKLTAVVQVVAEQTAADDYEPELEWANLRYELTPDLSLRVGRVALPAFLVSEHRKVSYATPWVRPPVELYGLIPVFTVDGVEATYRSHAGDWTNTLNVNLGRSKTDFPRGFGTAEAKRAWNVNATFQRGRLTSRFAIAGADLDIDAFDPLFAGFRAFGPEGQAIAERFEVDGRPFLFGSGGAEYDPGRWFAIAEVGWLDTDSALGARLAGYLTGGYRWGSVTPYATYSRSEVLGRSTVPGLSLSGLPPELVPVAAGLNAGLNGLLRGAPAQQNLSVGGRWDFTPGMALKLQVDFIDRLDGSSGTFVNEQPGFEPGGSAQLVSLATVFVF